VDAVDLAQIIEESGELVCVADLDGRIVFLNAAGVRIVGEAAGRSLEDLVHVEDRAIAHQARQEVRAGRRWDGELRLHDQSDGEISTWSSFFALRDRATGEPNQIATVARDLRGITALERTNRELDAFTYSVSHDLRSPIRHISGFSELLIRHARAQLDSRATHYVETIARAARDAGKLVDDLLSFSRMGRTQLQRSTVDLNALVELCRKEATDEAAGREVEWTVGKLPTLKVDAAMMRLAIKNLFSNALKYTRKQPAPAVEVGATESHDGITLFVRDNGVGFDMKHVGKLFGVFQRLHGTHEFEGTGIGLANVKRIVERHRGTVRAEGAPGRGASFFLTFPRS
jgi:PAS domain S-box-containing protein